MVAEIFGGISAFKAMFDMTKSINEMTDTAKRDRLTIELQKQILTAQAAQTELIEEVGKLKTKLASFETWDSDKQRYELKTLGSGSFAYALKPDAQPSEPTHYVCQPCYENRKRRVLQRKPSNTSAVTLGKPSMLGCPECKTEIIG